MIKGRHSGGPFLEIVSPLLGRIRNKLTLQTEAFLVPLSGEEQRFGIHHSESCAS
jgi:hypothetical protein